MNKIAKLLCRVSIAFDVPINHNGGIQVLHSLNILYFQTFLIVLAIECGVVSQCGYNLQFTFF